MTAVFHEAFYQGYPCNAAQYRRSPGLMPEHGYVDISMELLKNKRIRIVGRGVPWRAINGIGVHGGIDIRTQLLVEQNFRGQTVTSPPEIKAPENDAFNMFGDLLLRTRRFPSGAIIDEIRYRDVYVDAAGLEEITRDLAQVKEHKRGTIRVPLTDIRKWHQNMGPLFGKMNWKFRAARAHPGTDVPMDPDTLKDGEKTPWTLTEVLAHYYKLLPGTPRIVNLD